MRLAFQLLSSICFLFLSKEIFVFWRAIKTEYNIRMKRFLYKKQM